MNEFSLQECQILCELPDQTEVHIRTEALILLRREIVLTACHTIYIYILYFYREHPFMLFDI